MTVKLRDRLSKYIAYADVENEEPVRSAIEHTLVDVTEIEAVYERTDGRWRCWGVWVRYYPINADGSVNTKYKGGESLFMSDQPQWLLDFILNNTPTGPTYPLDVALGVNEE
jgi:hypothetical protein